MGLLRNICYLLRSAEIDNCIYMLHYRCTVLILLVFSFIITCRLLFGNSFTCVGSDRDFTAEYLNTFCYAKTPFLMVSAFVSSGSLFPGVDKRTRGDDYVLTKSFYPWVNLFFLLLAVLFYLPHLFWKLYERRTLARVTCDIDRPLGDDVSKENALNGLVKFLKAMHGKSTMYATVYLLTEMLNFVVDVLLTAWLLYFFQISAKSENATGLKFASWEDFFDLYFPLAGKCKISKYGNSGDIKTSDSLCLMPLNQLYGYMFLFLYAWFIMLCVLSACVLLYRVLVVSIPPLRLKLLRFLLLGVDHNLLLRLDKQYSFGDLLMLNFVKKNLLPHDFARLVLFILEKEHTGD